MMAFSDEDIYEAVNNHLPEVSNYVNSHGGGITLLGTKNGAVYIELTGTCQGCAMSLMTTKMVVQRELRKLIHPELNVVNIDGTPENVLPDNLYKEDEPEPMELKEPKEGWIDKIKNLL